MNILGYLGGHCGSLGAPFGLILALLGRLLDPFWLSWDVLGRLFRPSWPKFAQDSEKNLDFSICLPEVGSSWDPKIEKNRCRERHFFKMHF